MIKILFSFLTILAIALSAHAAESDVGLEFEGRYWFTHLKASARFDDQVRGTDIDLERDLDLGNKNFPEGRFTWYTGPKSNLFFDVAWAKWDSERTLERTINIRDRMFTLGARVDSELDFQMYILGWIWQFIDLSDGLVKLGTLVDVRAAHTVLSVDGAVNNFFQHVEESRLTPMASIGFALDINPIQGITLYARGSGIPNTPYGYFIDGEAGIKIIPFKNFSIVGGYRYEDFRTRNASDTIEEQLRLTGPFAGLSLRF